MDGHAATSARLQAMGSLTIRDYLKTALPQEDVLDIVPAPPAPAAKPAPEPQPDQNEKKAEVPFYIKRRGKGKGRPVMYNLDHSSVAQIYEFAAQMDVPEPVFNHTRTGASHLPNFTVTVEFDNLHATSSGDAGSIKEAKEDACFLLAHLILARNARTITR